MSAGPQQQHHQHAASPSKTSSDSGQQPGLERWSQRRLQRLNTEQGFRDQRSGQVHSTPLPAGAHAGSEQLPPSSSHSSTHSYAASTQYSEAQQASQPLQHHLPQPQQQTGYQTPRAASASQPNVGLATNTLPANNNSSRSSPYSPSGYASQEPARPEPTQSRSFTQQAVPEDEAASMSNNGGMPVPKTVRAGNGNGNRQSVHVGVMSREGSYVHQGGQAPAYNVASQVQQFKNAQGQTQSQPQQSQQQQPGEVGRATPQPQTVGEEMSEEDIAQLQKDHKELRKAYSLYPMPFFDTDGSQVKNTPRSRSITSRKRIR